jgi:hypothetical protein
MALPEYVKRELFHVNLSVVGGDSEKLADRLHALFSTTSAESFSGYATELSTWVKERHHPKVSAKHYLYAHDYFIE